ncbi:MAG: hypothetical protein ACOZCL_11770 [Bacillota bacterium]
MESSNHVNSDVRKILSIGEQVLWSGKPKLSVLFNRSDILFIPFSIIWCVIAIIWELKALDIFSDLIGKTQKVNIVVAIFPLIGLVAVVFGLYLCIGRLIYKYWSKKNTDYYITNERILIINNKSTKSFKEMYIKSIPSISKYMTKNGSGNIYFGNITLGASLYFNSGLDFYVNIICKDMIAFFDIEGVEEVYKLVNNMRIGI